LMKLKVLGSSSKGNCYILESPTGSLLLECGLPWPQIQKGLNFDLSSVKDCLITHEHKDHSKSVKEIMQAGIDCHMSTGTAKALDVYNEYRCLLFNAGRQGYSSGFATLAFDTEHDAADPLGFLIKYEPTKEKILFLTDSYYCKYTFKDLNYIMIECNYIKATLDANIAAGLIDERMKSRLLQSHFSLEHVIQFLKANDLSQCREIILLHLSSHNSDAARMIQEVKEATGITPKIAKPGLEVELQMNPY
jgi:phosphoribosyl 1,2-cyclic phosphodiesterase